MPLEHLLGIIRKCVVINWLANFLFLHYHIKKISKRSLAIKPLVLWVLAQSFELSCNLSRCWKKCWVPTPWCEGELLILLAFKMWRSSCCLLGVEVDWLLPKGFVSCFLVQEKVGEDVDCLAWGITWRMRYLGLWVNLDKEWVLLLTVVWLV